jgi:hypothetical protein
VRYVCAGALAGALLLAGCSSTANEPPATSVSSPGTPTVSSEAPQPESSAKPKPRRNDLATGEVSRTIRAGNIEVSVRYSTKLPSSQWTAAGSKPLNVSASARMVNGSTQKIYLSRVTVYLDAQDQDGPIEAPAPLEDTTDVTPGFLFRAPATYLQEFYVPPLTEGAVSVTLRMRYEMLLETTTTVKGKDVRDYARQTATDTLVIALDQR